MRSGPETAIAYQIVWSMLAPELVGVPSGKKRKPGANGEKPARELRKVTDANRVAACNHVLEHWQRHGNGARMPDEVRQLCECWAERWGEFFE